ncbi:MAG: dihydrofolate reductase [Oligoflexia bacterium]|nr:dihydrofolate reductase [Oligoflexia bacterium]
MKIYLIAALGTNRVIGINNTLPWRVPADLKRFRALTRNHAVIMGRKTWESLGRPLPDRLNIVITRNRSFAPVGALGADSLENALKLAGSAQSPNPEECFIIGGAEIYRLALPLADRLYLTEVDYNGEGDAWFPEWDPSRFHEASREDYPASDEAPAYRFLTYKKD